MPQAFKVVLSRKTGDIEQQSTQIVTASSKKRAGDIALGRAEEDGNKVEWVPALAEGITPGEDIALVSSEPTDELPTRQGNPNDPNDPNDPAGGPPNAETEQPASDHVIDGVKNDTTDAGTEDGRKAAATQPRTLGGNSPTSGDVDEVTIIDAPSGNAVSGGRGTQSTVVRGVPDLPGLGTRANKIRSDTGAMVVDTPEALEQRRRAGITPPAADDRARSHPDLAGNPLTGDVKKALNNPMPTAGDGQGRTLSTNYEHPKDAGEFRRDGEPSPEPEHVHEDPVV